MGVPFDQLPDTARVWIYQASRPLTAAEQAAAQPALARFAEAWTSHGRQLRAGAEFRHNHFLLIGLDEAVAGASGCSIDASVRFVQELESALGVELLEKSRLAFWRGDNVRLIPLSRLKMAVAAGEVLPDHLYFNNALTIKGELEEKWAVPAAQSWLVRYFAEAEKK